MIYIIIYVIGFIVTSIFYILSILDERDYTYNDILSTLSLAVCSWITIISVLLMTLIDNMNTDTVIFKKRK